MQCVNTHTRRCYMFSSAGRPVLQSRGVSQYSKPLQVPCAKASALSVWAVLSVICLQSKQGLSGKFSVTLNVFIIWTLWALRPHLFKRKQRETLRAAFSTSMFLQSTEQSLKQYRLLCLSHGQKHTYWEFTAAHRSGIQAPVLQN